MSLTLGPPSPAPSTIIPAGLSLQVPLADPAVGAFSACAVTVVATYPSGAVELVYASAIGGFTPLYAPGSTAPALSATGPWSLLVTRSGGWPASVSLDVEVTDSTGQRADSTWAWTLAQASLAARAPSQPQPASQSVYGSDCRTFAPLASGALGVDPSFALTQDPNIVMTEQIGRILSMPRGALWYAPNLGYDLRMMINKATNGDFVQTQAGVIQAVSLHPQIKSVSCLIRPLSAKGAYSVNVNGVGALGPFSCVFQISPAGIAALGYT